MEHRPRHTSKIINLLEKEYKKLALWFYTEEYLF